MEPLECPDCGSRDVTNINYDRPDGGILAFYSCPRCERRWWRKDGEIVSLPDAVAFARREKPSRS